MNIHKHFLLIFLLFPLLLHAQDADYELDAVTIYSLRTEIRADQVGRNITVIPARDISAYPVQSLDELLRYVPGVEVKSRGAMGSQADITIRGSSFNQVLVLLDGMRVNDPLTGHFNSNIPIAPAEIEQIEILKGAAASQWGPDAVGGIIHIITKTFSQKAHKKGIDAETTALYGENDLFHVNAGVTYHQEKWSVSGGALMNQSDGHVLPSDSLRGDFDINTLSASAAFRPNDKLQIALRGAYDDRLFNAQYFYTISPFDLSREQVKRIWTQGMMSYTHSDKHRTQLDVGYQTTSDSFLFNPAFAANTHTTQYINIQVHHHIQLNEWAKLVVGAQFDERIIESSDRGDHNTSHVGAFATSFLNPIDNLNLMASLRGDYDAAYGFELLPQLSVMYEREKWSVRAFGGRSTRAAGFTERFVSTNLPALSPGRNLGNPDLEAERAWNVELGADLKPLKWLTFRTTFFHRNARNLIDYILTNESEIPNGSNLTENADYFFAQNLGEVNTVGAEAELWVSHRFNEQMRVEGRMGYMWLNSATPDGAASKYIASHSHHLLSTSGQLAHNRFRLSINGLWKQRDPEAALDIQQELKNTYSVWNARVDVNVFQQKLWLTGQCTNLFDVQYADVLGAVMPGRWLSAGIVWKMK